MEETGAEFGISKQRVHQILDRVGVAIRHGIGATMAARIASGQVARAEAEAKTKVKRDRQLRQKTIAALAFGDGYRLREIARFLDFNSPQHVNSLLRKIGAPFRKPEAHEHMKRRWEMRRELAK